MVSFANLVAEIMCRYFIFFCFISIIEISLAQPAYVWIERGTEHFNKKAFSDAILDFDNAVKADPKSSSALCFRARCKQALNKKDEALVDFNNAVKNASKEYTPYFYRAQYFEQSNKPNDAIADYDAAIKLNPKNTESHINKGFLLVSLMKQGDAELDFDEAIKLGTRNAKVYVGKASIAREKNNIDVAIANYSKAIEIDANAPESYFFRGELYFQQKKYKEVIIDLNNASNKNYKSEKLYNLRAQAYIKQNNFDAALADLAVLMTTYKSKDVEVYYYSGFAKFLKNDWGGAAKDYSKAISYKPTYAEAILERGKCYLMIGKQKYQMAQMDFMQVLKLKNDNEEAAFGIGKIFFETNKNEQAIEYFSKSIKQLPNAETYYLRSKCFYKMQKTKECCNDLELAAKLGSKDAAKDIKFVCK